MHPLRVWRVRNEVSLRQLAQAAGVAEHTVYRWETGRHQPSPLSCRMLADVLGDDWPEVWEQWNRTGDDQHGNTSSVK